MVMLTIGPGRRDATCGNSGLSLPHLIVGSSPTGSERVFSSGNERTTAIFPNWNITDAGYHMKKTDQLALIVDLMNDTPQDQVVYLTLTFDILPIETPGMHHMRPVWFDVAQCLTSDYPALKQNGSFQLLAPTWTADFDGDIVGMAGHLHDGGQNVTIYVDNKLICTSAATYGSEPEFISPHAMVPGSAVSHISKMNLCINDNLGLKELKKGQRWVLKADYDYDKDKGDLHDNGKQESIMGIAIMYVKEKNLDRP
jgi:Stress up-regulated Nod 19